MVMHMQMDISKDWTLGEAIAFEGHGLHTGRPSQVLIKPIAKAGFWLQTPQGRLLLDTDRVERTDWSTTVAGIQTIEHVLAAAYGLGLSALCFEIDGPECPILDGSAKLWGEAMLAAGIRPLESKRRWLKAPAWQAEWGAVRLELEPADELLIRYTIDYRQHDRDLYQSYDYRWSPESFMAQIAPARTFTFAADVARLQAAGLALGGRLENALVLDEQGQADASQTLRFENEPVRHKILDLLGDLALSGARLLGRITISGGGHQSHVKMIRSLGQQASL